MTHQCCCAKCKMAFWITDEFYAVARHTEQTFYCPAGHQNYYPRGESTEDKLRRERDRALQQIAQRDDEIIYVKKQRDVAERRVAAAKGQITKIKNRASKGLCPCCNRSFINLARHMAGKHPGFVSEPTADEHVVN